MSGNNQHSGICQVFGPCRKTPSPAILQPLPRFYLCCSAAAGESLSAEMIFALFLSSTQFTPRLAPLHSAESFSILVIALCSLCHHAKSSDGAEKKLRLMQNSDQNTSVLQWLLSLYSLVIYLGAFNVSRVGIAK